MKLEDKVVSLEIAQKLYDMGVRIETEYRYYPDRNANYTARHRSSGTYHVGCSIYPAPLPCEILDVLPDSVIVEIAVFDLLIEKSVQGFHADYIDFTEGGFKEYLKGHQCEVDTLANKVAKLLIHLLENKLISLEDVNK